MPDSPNNVVKFPSADETPDEILDDMKGRHKAVIALGIDADGFVLRSSDKDLLTVQTFLEMALEMALEIVKEQAVELVFADYADLEQK